MLYKIYFVLLWPFVRLFYRIKIYGRENIPPEGPALICGNHSSLLDPVLVGLTMGIRRQMHFMVKKEIMAAPVLGLIVRSTGAFSVDRDSGISAIKNCFRLLNEKKMVMMFPEGTRNPEHRGQARSGAAMIALRAGVTILPVYITPGKKHFFSHINVIVGKSYLPSPDKGLPKNEQYSSVADDLMHRIYSLEGAC